MDKQEFLDTLKNPVRTEILKRIDDFFASTEYFAWDLVVSSKHIEKDGSHDLYIELSDPNYFIQVEKALLNYFTPTNGNWNVVMTNSSPRSSTVYPKTPKSYTKFYAIVEARCYTMNHEARCYTMNQHV